MEKLLLPFLLFIAIFGSQCFNLEGTDPEKEIPDPILPNITTTGLGTFGCLVNDIVFLPDKRSLFPNTPRVSIIYYAEDGSFFIEAKRFNKEGEKEAYIALRADSVLREQTYPFSWGEYYNAYPLSCNSVKRFQLDTSQDNSLTILKIDAINRIISGLFECSMVNDLCAPTEITSGRFDMAY